MAGGDERPIIIKRKKVVGGDAHHGGAWKVAYADFVTAMMAFFLLMWLLNATSEEQKSGLADYFDTHITIARSISGGDGPFGGDVIRSSNNRDSEGSQRTKPAPGEGERDATGDAGNSETAAAKATGERQALTAIEEAFQALAGESEIGDPTLQHIRTRLSDEGLVIELFDTEGRPLFESGRAEPTPMMRELVEMVTSVAVLVTNDVAVTGHTDATPFQVDGDDGNWGLSAGRAQAVRRLLLGSGLSADRVARVTGKAATSPVIEDDPTDPRNRRVEITLLRRTP